MKNAKNKHPRSVFIIRMIYSIVRKYPARLQKVTLGYFTDLARAENYLSYPNKKAYWFLEHDYPFKIFEIEEQGMDYFMQFVRSRIYDRSGKLHGSLQILLVITEHKKQNSGFSPATS